MELNIERIKYEMSKLKINQSELARMMGVTKQAISYDFKNRPIKAAEKFAKVFEIDPKDLIS